jgi:hypothetical protein
MSILIPGDDKLFLHVIFASIADMVSVPDSTYNADCKSQE